MARYVMQQKVWSWTDTFVIKDAAGSDAFQITQKMWSWGNQLTFQDLAGNDLAFIKEKVMSWGPTYEIHRDDAVAAIVKKKLMSFRPHFDVELTDGSSADVDGNFMDREYTISRNGSQVGAVSMQWFTWSDTYGIDVADGEDQVLVLALAVVIDMVCHGDPK